jgi:hypothetical protein
MDVTRSTVTNDLASRQPSRPPSSQTSRHVAGVKRLELMACQPAGPLCRESFRSWTRVCVILQEQCIRYTAVCLMGLLCMS